MTNVTSQTIEKTFVMIQPQGMKQSPESDIMNKNDGTDPHTALGIRRLQNWKRQ
jgi:hypothetical protein